MRSFGMYHDDDIAAVRESWERRSRSPGVESIDARLYRPHGEDQWVRIFMRVQRNENAPSVRAVGPMLDIQEEKQAELAPIEAKLAKRRLSRNPTSRLDEPPRSARR